MSIPDFNWKPEDVQRLKAMWDGQADAPTQRATIKHLIEMICGINQIELVPGNPDMTAFNSGRKWVARQLQNAITLPISNFKKDDNEPRSSSLPTATERAARVAVAGGSSTSTGRRTR